MCVTGLALSALWHLWGLANAFIFSFGFSVFVSTQSYATRKRTLSPRQKFLLFQIPRLTRTDLSTMCLDFYHARVID